MTWSVTSSHLFAGRFLHACALDCASCAGAARSHPEGRPWWSCSARSWAHPRGLQMSTPVSMPRARRAALIVRSPNARIGNSVSSDRTARSSASCRRLHQRARHRQPQRHRRPSGPRRPAADSSARTRHSRSAQTAAWPRMRLAGSQGLLAELRQVQQARHASSASACELHSVKTQAELERDVLRGALRSGSPARQPVFEHR